MLEVVREAQSLNILLQARRDIPLVAPKTVSRQFVAHIGEEGLNLGQLVFGTGGGSEAECVVV